LYVASVEANDAAGSVVKKSKPKPTLSSELDDPRGEAELTICSQNLENLGTYGQSKARLPSLTPQGFEDKQQALVRRFKEIKCDVIAVQEVLGKTVEQSDEVLRQLAALLQKKTNRQYEVRSAESNDPLSRVGFILAKDRVERLNELSYAKLELPKLTPKERPRGYSRAPYEIQLQVKSRGESVPKTVTLVNFHFKSKAGRERDPAELEWESYRMQMAEALRRVVENRHSGSFASGETLLVLLGDRNSNFDTASARILEGSLVLKQFQDPAACRLTKRGFPVCKQGSYLPQRLFSVISGDPELRTQQGTYQYQGTFSFIDDILLPAESLRTAWRKFDKEGQYDSGIVRKYPEASDHAMVYVRLNW
jgi:predicted extracellular nuclease